MADHREDRELVERMLAGDGEAFGAFADRYTGALYRFALSRLHGDRELTREIVQTSMCKALAKLDTYRGDASLLTWLCACCRNEVFMHLRRRRTRPVALEIEEDLEPAAEFRASNPGSPEAVALRRETAERVHMTLDVLPGHYARALEWKYCERIPVREIAERLSLGPKAAESLLTRAWRAFRQGFEDLRPGNGPVRDRDEGHTSSARSSYRIGVAAPRSGRQGVRVAGGVERHRSLPRSARGGARRRGREVGSGRRRLGVGAPVAQAGA